MKRGTILVTLSLFLVTSLLLASCSSVKTSTSLTTTPLTSTAASNSTTTLSTTTTASPISTVATVTTTASTTGNWWNSLGTPQYGGVLVDRVGANIQVWDPYLGTAGLGGFSPYMEQMFCRNYTTDPSVWDFSLGWLPSAYAAGLMITGYEMPNTYTVICHLRQDIYYQNIAPSFGRQLTSADVVGHYDRIFGLGNGYTTPAPYFASIAGWKPCLSVVPTDKFTVTFNWKPGTSPLSILNFQQEIGSDNQIEDPDAIAAYTSASNPVLNNWHNAIGTGPFMLTDFVDSSSATYMANPSYWGTDLRWPQNKLPYISEFKILIISSNPTAEAAMRVGKIDAYGAMPTQDALNMMKTNPDIVAKQKPQGTEYTLDPRNDLAPFNNLNVRIAVQHAINIPLIASTYYLGYATPWPSSLTQNQMGIGGWGDPYTQWPADVQGQYTYDPTLAKQILATAGFPNGFTTTLALESDADQGLFQIVESELQSVGINTNVTIMDPPTWQAYVIGGRQQQGFAARNQGILGVTFDIFSQFAFYTPTFPYNYCNVNDPIMIKYQADAAAAQSVGQVQQLLHDANLYVAQQHFEISLAQPSIFNMVQPWIKGNPGANTLGNATNGNIGDGVPVGVWIDQSIKSH